MVRTAKKEDDVIHPEREGIHVQCKGASIKPSHAGRIKEQFVVAAGVARTTRAAQKKTQKER